MKIKQTKQVDLRDLISHAWQELESNIYTEINNSSIQVSFVGGEIDTNFGLDLPDEDSLFEIEEEIEIDENTELELVVENYKWHIITQKGTSCETHHYKSIKQIIDARDDNHTTVSIHHVNADGTMQLLWIDGKMIEENEEGR